MAEVKINSAVDGNTNYGGTQINGTVITEALHVGSGKDAGTEHERHYLRIVYLSDPIFDKRRIENAMGTPPKELCSWIVDDGGFVRWRRRASSADVVSLLWITGDTSQARTLLFCGILNELRDSPVSGDRMHYFFCERGYEGVNNANAVLRGLIYTLANQERTLVSWIAKHLGGADQRALEGRNSWQILCKIFADMMEDLKGRVGDGGESVVFLAIDAVDECGADLDKLLELVAGYRGVPRIRWLLTSRCTQDIDRGFGFGVNDKVEVDANRCPEEARRILGSMETLRCQQAAQGLLGVTGGKGDLYRRALSAVVVAERTLNINEWCELCELTSSEDKNEVNDVMEKCGAFIALKDDSVTIVSESAKDFLQKGEGAALFHDGLEAEHYRIFVKSLEIMDKTLGHNMFGLDGPGSEIEAPACRREESEQRVQKWKGVSIAARAYACAYWAQHLLASGRAADDSVATFLEKHLLHWLEHVCVKGRIKRTLGSWAQLVQSLQSKRPKAAVTQLVIEVHRFMIYNVECIAEYPLQIYQSALVFFTPSQGPLHRLFQKHQPRWVTITRTPQEQQHRQQLQTLSLESNDSEGGEVSQMVFSSDGTRLAAVLDGLKAIKVWDLTTGRCLWNLDHNSRISWIAFHPQKRRLIATADGGPVRFWDLTSKKEAVGTPAGSTGAFSPDGRFLALASEKPDSRICIWDWEKGDEPTVLQQSGDRWGLRPEPAHSLAFSADGRGVISAHRDDVMRFWDTASRACVRTMLSGDVRGIATPASCTPPGKSVPGAVVVWANNEAITTWDLHADDRIGKLVLPFRDDVTTLRKLALAPDGNSFATALDDKVDIWDGTGDNVPRHSLLNLGGAVQALAFSADSSRVAVASFAGITLWDFSGAGDGVDGPRSTEDHAGPVGLLRVSGGETPKLVSASADAIKVWHLNSSDGEGTWLPRQNAPSTNAKILGVAVSPDGTRLLSISDGQAAVVWDLQTFQQDHIIPGRGLSLTAAWLPKGDRLAVLLSTGAIKLWDVHKRAQVRLYPQRGGPARRSDGGCITVAPDGKRMATSFRKTIEIWNSDAPGGKRVRHWDCGATASALRFATPRAHDSVKYANQLAALYRDGDIKIWDVDRGFCLGTVGGRTGATELVAFEPGVCGVVSNVGPMADMPGRGGYEIDMDGGWIKRGSEKLLWLPPDCRPLSALVVPAQPGAVTTIVLGCWTGRVLILRLSG